MSQLKSRTQDELEDILNAALDDLEDLPGDIAPSAASPPPLQQEQQSLGVREEDVSKEALTKTLQHLALTEEGADDIAAILKAADELKGDQGDEVKGGEKGAEETDMDKAVAKTLYAMSQGAAGMEGMDAANVEAAGADIMEAMMSEFDKLGEKEDFNEVFDNLLEQLLSRDIMYEPLKAITDAYPAWLAAHKERFSEEEYQKNGKQYQCLQRILAVYETEPDNYARLSELMQDLQEYGQLPAEIVKELAPGLQFGADGMPTMPNVGEGMMPDMSAFMAAGGDPANCTVS